MYYKAIIIGASTGGPSALRTILKSLPKSFPIPILVVQRIPQGIFAESLAEALDEASDITVRILKEKDVIHQDEAVLIPGGFNLTFEDENNTIKLVPGDDPDNSPSISSTIKQAGSFFKGPIIFSVLTGICLEDHLINEAKNLSDHNGYIVVQKPETCFIDDLPQTIIQSNISNDIIELERMGPILTELSGKV